MLTRLFARNFKQFAEIDMLRDPSDRFWVETKASDDLLDSMFDAYFTTRGLPNLLRKTDYHRLASFVAPDQLPCEVSEVLDLISEQAAKATPGGTAS